MTNVNINDELYKELVEYYNKLDKIEYPTLKNFVEKGIRGMLKK